jgi:acyl-CoA synthetase (NDP forming)
VAARRSPEVNPMTNALDALLRPRSVALIGASNRPRSLGGMITERFLAAGFTGRFYPVNPKQAEVHSHPAFASIQEVPGEVDLAIIVVPRDGVLPALEQCRQKNVGAVSVITAGFREAGEEGLRLEEQLLEALGPMRMIGPNCMGQMNTDPAVRLDGTFSPVPALPGPIAFASQSGALGVVVLNICHERSIGFSQFVSLGNKADVTENDLIAAWEDDPAAPVVALYLESFSDAMALRPLAERASRKKPIVLVKAGRTSAGARAASSHTGALAGADAAYGALCEQTGMIRAESVEQLLDVAMLLSRAPLPAGRRVAVQTNAGGPAILATDAIIGQGLEMASLAETTQAALREQLPAEAAVGNPVDMIASAGPDEYAACLQRILADPAVDAVVTITVQPPLYAATDILDALRPVIASADKPVLTVFLAGPELMDHVRSLPEPPPVFRSVEGAAAALSHAATYATWRDRQETATAARPMDHGAIAAELARSREREDGYLPADATFRTLELAGLPVVPWRLVDAVEELPRAGEEVGYPVVLKAEASGLVHKSDVGGVAVDLRDAAALTAAGERMVRRLDDADVPAGSRRWLVQAFRPGGREVIVGGHRDPSCGPMVMFGLGGRYVEVFGDVRFALAPLRGGDAERLVRGIRGYRLLEGVRGEAPVADGIAESALRQVGELLAGHPEIAELDVNPLMLAPSAGDCGIVDARIRVEPGKS